MPSCHRRRKAAVSGPVILLMCAAVTFFAGLDTTAKYLGSKAGIPTSEVVWVRFLGQFFWMAISQATHPGQSL